MVLPRACLPAWLLCAALVSAATQAQDAGALRVRHAAMEQQFANTPFGRPLHVESTTSGGRHQGDIHAIIETPHSEVAAALADPAHWCDILMLQFNVKHCTLSGGDGGGTLTTFFTKKPRDRLDSAYRIEFGFQVAAASADYLSVALNAPTGPVGTRDYQIRLEAAPLDSQRTFIHLSYAYRLNALTWLAIEAYLLTAGRNKVGFTVVERLPDGGPVYVDGVRGIVERSAMRYYIAIETFVHTLPMPPEQRFEARLRRWYAEVYRYPQLHEPLSAD